MEGKGLKVMLTLLWLMIQAGSPLLGRSPARAWGLRHAQSLGQKAWSCLAGADAARSAVNCSPGARAGCFALASGSGLSCAAVKDKVHHSRSSSGPFWEKGNVFLSAVVGWWEDLLRGCSK